MAKRLNVVFDDESLYRALKVEAARRGIPAKDIVAAAVAVWLEAEEEQEDIGASRDAIAEYQATGGVGAEQVHAQVEQILARRERAH